ncbi:tail fiber assembly protein [Enterobacter asburiae]
MTFELKNEAQTITIYNFLADTHEFIGSGDAYIPPQTGLPAHCTDIAPPKNKNGYVAVFNSNNNTWSLIEDHRGVTAYNKVDGKSFVITELGSLPENTTFISPDGDFKKWNDGVWIDDDEARKAFKKLENENIKKRLMAAANEKISILQGAVDYEMATEKEKEELSEWIKYRVLVNRLIASDYDMDIPPTPGVN